MLKSAGRFIFIPMTTKFPKGFLTPQEHITLLKNRGLLFEGKEQKAATYLKNIGYYRLSAYFYPLLQTPKELHIFKQGSSFRNVMNMYRFDRKFRVLVFNEIEKIEVAFRSCITNMASEAFNDIFWMTDPQYFADTEKFNSSMAAINSELDKTKEDFIKHFKTSYSDPYPPSWMIAEILPFGNLRYIYDNLKSSSLKKQIAQYFGLQPKVFFSWLIVLGGLRNICCHHSRAWNRILPVITQNPQKTSFGWIDITQTDNRRMYYRLCMIKYLLFTISPNNTFKYKLKDLIAAYPTIDIKAMGFPENWDNEPVWR